LYVERIQVEEGFLDGLDLSLVAGLNVIIGARGTGKTSLIELIRFCLDAPSYTAETSKRSREHALSVLGAGQVTVTLSDGENRTSISRTASDAAPRASGPYAALIVFSQTEIETVGLQSRGRLQLVDGFIPDQRRSEVAEVEAISRIRSLTAEAHEARREIDELQKQVAGLVSVDQNLAELAPREEQLVRLSGRTARDRRIRIRLPHPAVKIRRYKQRFDFSFAQRSKTII
jgi:chromosome segregation ATPase